MSGSTYASQSVLGAILLSPDTYWEVVDLVEERDFMDAAERKLWAVIAQLMREGRPVDAVTVGDLNSDLARMAVDYANTTPSTANIREYAKLMRQTGIASRVAAAGSQIAKLPVTGRDAGTALEHAQALLAACGNLTASRTLDMRQLTKAAIGDMQTRMDQRAALTGIPTSLEPLDNLLSGWQPSDLIVIGGRPSHGKTALALQAALQAARSGFPSLFMSLEMASTQLVTRALSNLTGLSGNLLRQPATLDEADWPHIADAASALSQLPLWINDASDLAISPLCAMIRQAHAAHGIKIVFIDYLSRMTTPPKQMRVDALQDITRSLKSLAKTLGISTVLLSQLKRNEGREPMLEDLRESGAIEQDADSVVFVWQRAVSETHRKIIVAKQRNGPVGQFWTQLDGAAQRFTVSNPPPAKEASFVSRFGRKSHYPS